MFLIEKNTCADPASQTRIQDSPTERGRFYFPLLQFEEARFYKHTEKDQSVENPAGKWLHCVPRRKSEQNSDHNWIFLPCFPTSKASKQSKDNVCSLVTYSGIRAQWCTRSQMANPLSVKPDIPECAQCPTSVHKTALSCQPGCCPTLALHLDSRWGFLLESKQIPSGPGPETCGCGEQTPTQQM